MSGRRTEAIPAKREEGITRRGEFMKSREGSIFIAAAVLFCLTYISHSQAASINTLSSWDGYTGINDLGEEWGGALWVSRSYGQTFKITSSDAKLNAITFGIWDYYPVYASQTCKFEVCVSAWNGSQPTGQVLFRSAPLIPPNGSSWSTMTATMGNVPVTKDQQYIAFLTATNFMDGIQSPAAVSAVLNDVYADGAMFFHTAFGPGDELTSSWSSAGAIDMAFKLDYTNVPEPTTLLLLGLGAAFARKRKA
jgi:hypothetical protein